jgi:hypothetical protein
VVNTPATLLPGAIADQAQIIACCPHFDTGTDRYARRTPATGMQHIRRRKIHRHGISNSFTAASGAQSTRP